MRIVFVRHGHPDYRNDCLTPLGRMQAEAVADRLMHEGICEIYASTQGRALETAEAFSRRTGLPVWGFDFMREVRWGSSDGTELPFGGHPWQTVADMVRCGEDLLSPHWREEERFSHNIVLSHIDRIVGGVDGWLSDLGYVREGAYYRVVGENTDRTVAMFSHGGASTVVLSYLFGLPFPFMASAIRPNFTAVTVLKLPDEKGALVTPTIELLNDDRHLSDVNGEIDFGQ